MRPVPARPTSRISTANPMRQSHPTRPIRRRPSLRIAGVSLEVGIRPAQYPWCGRCSAALDRRSDQALLPTLLSTLPALAAGLRARGCLDGARPRGDLDRGASAGSFETAVGRCPAPASIRDPSASPARRPSTGTARSGALRPAAVFGAVGRKEAVRLQGEPRPPVVVSPGGRNRCGSPPPGTRQAGQPQVSRMTRVSGSSQRSAQPCHLKHRSRGPALAAGSAFPTGSPM
jgi:hypothetical protein